MNEFYINLIKSTRMSTHDFFFKKYSFHEFCLKNNNSNEMCTLILYNINTNINIYIMKEKFTNTKYNIDGMLSLIDRNEDTALFPLPSL